MTDLTNSDLSIIKDALREYNLNCKNGCEEQLEKFNESKILENQENSKELDAFLTFNNMDLEQIQIIIHRCFSLEQQNKKLSDEVIQLQEANRQWNEIGKGNSKEITKLRKELLTIGLERDELKEKIEKIKDSINDELDLDLHPQAEDLKTSLEVKRILDNLKEILGEPTS